MFYLLICVSGLLWSTHGYHYPHPTPPTNFYITTYYANYHNYESSRQIDSNQQNYEWDMSDQYSETFPSGDFVSKPSEGANDNPQAVPESTSRPVPTDSVSMEPKNTTRPPPQPGQPQSGPAAGIKSQPVPTLGELFAPSLQWHVGIYSKRFTPYMQVCGGSLVRADVVLSAAHCFWDDDVGALRAGLFAVAAGKLLRPWETEGEIYTQHSDIKEIKIPPRFQGVKTSFQDDIAILLLSRPLEYAPGVKPICLSFDLETEQMHLTSGNMATIAGWGLTTPNGLPSQRLNFLMLPYVDIQTCIRTAEPSFLKYITSDKICAGDQRTGRALCRGDSGGALAYYRAGVPYLLGVASTAPRDNNQCNAYAVATFTHARAQSAFLQEHVPGIGEGCESLYGNGTDPSSGGTQNMTHTKYPTIQPGVLLKAGGSSNVTDRSGEQVTRGEMVMMSVESGERSVVRVPVEGASTLVCNCYCKN